MSRYNRRQKAVNDSELYRDYLKDTQTYLSAMMKQLNWNVVEKRFEKADSILKIVRG